LLCRLWHQAGFLTSDYRCILSAWGQYIDCNGNDGLENNNIITGKGKWDRANQIVEANTQFSIWLPARKGALFSLPPCRIESKYTLRPLTMRQLFSCFSLVRCCTYAGHDWDGNRRGVFCSQFSFLTKNLAWIFLSLACLP